MRLTYTPKTNIAPENGWLEGYFPLKGLIFSGYVRFREGINQDSVMYTDHLYQVIVSWCFGLEV